MIKRRAFLKALTLPAWGLVAGSSYRPVCLGAGETGSGGLVVDPATAQDWIERWQKSILGDVRTRYCDKEMGEELGWLVSPFLNGFYFGYLATRDAKWVELLVDWTDACIARALKEPDGAIGWPKSGSGGVLAENLYSDSLLGEAMMLSPVVLMAKEIESTAALRARWGTKAKAYVELAHQVFQKWDSHDCWREVKGGGVWVVPAFGIDKQTGGWTAGYGERKKTGFSNPDNKQNHIARWLLAMHKASGKSVYRDRAELWFRVMRSRMHTRAEGKYFVWNYWEPAGPWDYKVDGSTQHWVGVHPNGGYYHIDLEGIVAAFESGLVFSREDIDRLIATNRDFMWNKQVKGARFQRIDGEPPDERWKNGPGLLWTPLVPYDQTLRSIFLANHEPAGWGGLASTPWATTLRVQG